MLSVKRNQHRHQMIQTCNCTTHSNGIRKYRRKRETTMMTGQMRSTRQMSVSEKRMAYDRAQRKEISERERGGRTRACTNHCTYPWVAACPCLFKIREEVVAT